MNKLNKNNSKLMYLIKINQNLKLINIIIKIKINNLKIILFSNIIPINNNLVQNRDKTINLTNKINKYLQKIMIIFKLI